MHPRITRKTIKIAKLVDYSLYNQLCNNLQTIMEKNEKR